MTTDEFEVWHDEFRDFVRPTGSRRPRFMDAVQAPDLRYRDFRPIVGTGGAWTDGSRTRPGAKLQEEQFPSLENRIVERSAPGVVLWHRNNRSDDGYETAFFRVTVYRGGLIAERSCYPDDDDGRAHAWAYFNELTSSQ